MVMPPQPLSNRLYEQNHFKVTRLLDVFSPQVYIFNLHSFAYFCNVKDQTQGLTMCARQALHAELHPSSFQGFLSLQTGKHFPQTLQNLH